MSGDPTRPGPLAGALKARARALRKRAREKDKEEAKRLDDAARRFDEAASYARRLESAATASVADPLSIDGDDLASMLSEVADLVESAHLVESGDG